MRLVEVHLQNYKCFSDFQLSLQAQFNVLVGVNGSGKTSILQGISDALGALYGAPEVGQRARIDIRRYNGRVSFERQYPVRVWTKALLGKREITFFLEETSEGARSYGPLPRMGPKEPVWPILAVYQAHRQWAEVQPTEYQAVTQKQTRQDGHAHWWNSSSTVALESWVISKCLERLQLSSESGRGFDDYDDDDLALVNSALARAVGEMRGLRYDIREKALLVEFKDGRLALFNNLSHGQRAVTCLVADIARRICLLNPQLGARATHATPGVVLIDELDLHLHPAWQRSLTQGLMAAFPEVQFVVASHSPQVLGELLPEQIILLRGEETGHPQVSYGLDASAVLEIIVGVPSRDPEVQGQLDALFDTLERGRLEEAEGKLEELLSKAPGLPELSRAAALLKRKQLLGK